VRGRLIGVACAAGFLLTAPGAAAAPVALLDAPRAVDVALSGADVVVARETRRGGVTVDLVATSGGAARRVLSVPPPERGWSGRIRLAASAERVGAIVAFEDDGSPREWRVYAGPPAGPIELQARAGRRGWIPLELDVDADRVLVSELKSPRRARARLLVPGGVPVRLPFTRPLFSPALAGDRVAFRGSSRRGPRAPLNRVFVADWRSGEVVTSVPVPSYDSIDDDIDVAPDGRLVIATGAGLRFVSPGAPVEIGPGGEYQFARPRLVGDRVVVAERVGIYGQRPAVLDPATGGQHAAGVPSTEFETLAASEHGVAWLANGCVLFARLDDAPAHEPPAGPCPRAEAVIEDGDQVLRGRTLRLSVTCVAAPASGCRGTALVRDGGIVGRGRFRVPAGRTRLADVTLTRRGRARMVRLVRHYGEAFLLLDVRLVDGRVAGSPETAGTMIDRVARGS
jgi:hypothetical protein